MKKYLLIASMLLMIKLNAQTDTLNVPINSSQTLNITDLLVDNSNNYWITMKVGGVRKYDGVSWTTPPIANKVYSVLQGPAGDYWFATNIGLVQYDGVDTTVYNTLNSGIAGNMVLSLCFNNTDLWIGTTNGISVLSGASWQTYNTSNSQLNCDTINSIEVGNGVFYFNTARGMSKLSGGVVTNISANNIAGQPIRPTAIKINSTGVWVSVRNSIYNISGNSVVEIDDALDICPYLSGPPTVPVLRSIENTSNNGLACMTSNGIYELENNKSRFLYNFLPTPNANIVTRILKRKGNMYYYFTRDMATGNQLNLTKYDITQCLSQFGPLSLFCDDGGDSRALLNINQVSASMLDRGDMFWDLNSNPGYEVPKGSGSYAAFAGSIWIGGKVNNQLRTACQTYRQNGTDFWPGPLDTTDAANSDSLSLMMGSISKVNKYDVQNFIFNFNNGNVQSGNFIPSRGILNWPAQGSGNFSRNNAPFVDVNGNGVYDPLTGGDYPDIKGDQMLYHIYNDATGVHGETGSSGAMGIEVRQKSYAYVCDSIVDSMKVLNYTTFYEYEIINRSDTVIDSMYITYWNDSDLGFYNDDYIGCNVKENYGYIYCSDNYDEDGNGVVGYHNNLPCFSTAIMEGPIADAGDGIDNDHNGLVDEQGEQLGMSSFTHYNNDFSNYGNPSQQMHYYNYMRGIWKDGSTIKYGANGASGTLATKYMFPGDSDPVGYGVGGSPSNPMPQPTWTEITANNLGGDKRFLVGSGPFTLQAKDTTKIVYAMVFTQDETAPGNNLASVVKSELDVKRLKSWYNNNNFPSCLDLSTVSIKENKTTKLNYSLYPNPATNSFTLETQQLNGDNTIEVYDIVGKLVMKDNIVSNKQVFSIVDLASGIYIVKINDKLAPVSCKLIKE